MTRKIIGLEQAVKDYRKAKAGRWYHGDLMFDRKSGEVWTDFSYDADMSWIYDRKLDFVVDLGEMLIKDFMKGMWGSADISVENVSEYIEWKFSDEGDTDEQH